ncbi:MAG: hypothetical protein IJF48_05575, partial [Clostridia bacterium]|nr:hypothetical protein [Clostridia bacterium]
MKTILKKAKRTVSMLLALLMIVPMTVSLAVPASAETTRSTCDGINHEWTEWFMSNGVACGDEGEAWRECYECGAEEERILIKEHDWSNWYKRAYNCVSDVIEVRRCQDCNIE